MEDKVYVTVMVVFDAQGKMRPISLKWEDGSIYPIDKVTEIRSAPAMKAGGQGDRYTIRVKGREKYLFFEHSTGTSSNHVGRWFVERR